MSISDICIETLLSAPGLRRRPGQEKMLRLVAQVLAGEKPERVAVVEAGTGTGKSLAYLVPVMLNAIRNRKRAVVATGTKALQEQLARKDAPFAADLVEKVTGKHPVFAALYGKSNYLCPLLLVRRYHETQEYIETACPDAGRKLEEACYVEILHGWLTGGGSGLLDDFPMYSHLPGTESDRGYWWSRASAADDDADCASCAPPIPCPFRTAREAAQGADVVIANHHLVVADYLLRDSSGSSIFSPPMVPAPEILVVDEAHDFTDAVRASLEAPFSLGRVKRLVSDVLRFLGDAVTWTMEKGFRREVVYVREKAENAREYIDRNFPAVEAALGELFAWAGEKLDSRSRVLLFPGSVPPGAEDVYGAMTRFFSPGGLLSFPYRAVEVLGDAVGSKGDRDTKKELDVLERRCDRLTERAVELEGAFRRAILLENHYRSTGTEGDACWVEPRRFCACPVSVAGTLRDMWGMWKKIIFTSATIFPFPQSDGFQWFREKFGLVEAETTMGVVPSPFDYMRQMRAAVITDQELMPPADVADKDGQFRRVEALAEAVLRVSMKCPGGVLVLFTSFREMNAVAGLLRDRLPDRLLVQGEAGKNELLERFRSHGWAVLMGVASFWQGVDVPGDALQGVIVARLPFPQVDDPLIEAECWLAGKMKWKRVIQPVTAITLRQGVGRLVRTETDTGTVFFFDPRAGNRHKYWVQGCVPVPIRDVAMYGHGGYSS